ncbi:MAG: DUF1345 domain-containing protein [Candidatus Saccharibacteria bacterium]|nr:DUF1345 domain-containing protein [Rhodoferax sp.]
MYQHLSSTSGHQRLVYALIVGVAVALLPLPMSWMTRALLAWSASACLFVVLAWWLVWVSDAARTREHAQSQDQPSVLIFVVLLASVFACTGAIAVMQHQVEDLSAVARLGHLALSMLALALSWLLMQTIFAFRYAHLFYPRDLPGKTHSGGLEFPGKQPPDYFDFLYYAYVVGMTSQVSDVVVTSRKMRHLTLLHSVTSFAFNMLVLALSINVMSGAIKF